MDASGVVQHAKRVGQHLVGERVGAFVEVDHPRGLALAGAEVVDLDWIPRTLRKLPHIF